VHLREENLNLRWFGRVRKSVESSLKRIGAIFICFHVAAPRSWYLRFW
jgi:hypothetical protein